MNIGSIKQNAAGIYMGRVSTLAGRRGRVVPPIFTAPPLRCAPLWGRENRLPHSRALTGVHACKQARLPG